MEIELIEGCIADSFTADGKAFMDMSEMELKRVWLYLTQHILKQEFTDYKQIAVQNIMREMVEDFADTHETSDEPCEQCGDWIETFKMNI